MRRWDSRYLKGLLVLLLLYLFLVSIDMLGSAFKLFGKDFAERLIESTQNPFAGLLIGILATSIIQSSSTTTSIVVSLVAAGTLTPYHAVPIVMGANIGTTVTNTLVSIAHIAQKDEFEKALAAAIVHDFFNILSVAVFLPLQLATGFLSFSAGFLASAFQNIGGLKFASPIKVIVKPFSTLLIDDVCHKVAIVVLIVALILLFVALRYLVKTLKSIFLKRLEALFDQYIFRTVFRSLLFGLVLTTLVQSSSVTTSLVIPLVAAGILRLERVYPYTLGANIGTTVTAILAAMSTGQVSSIVVAFTHLLFNISGICIFLPLSQIPITLARTFAQLSMKNRLIPFVFILVTFFLLPLTLLYLTN